MVDLPVDPRDIIGGSHPRSRRKKLIVLRGELAGGSADPPGLEQPDEWRRLISRRSRTERDTTPRRQKGWGDGPTKTICRGVPSLRISEVSGRSQLWASRRMPDWESHTPRGGLRASGEPRAVGSSRSSGQPFRLIPRGGHARVVQLVDVVESARPPGRDDAGRRAFRPSYSLMFQDPAGTMLPQGTYRFQHPMVGNIDLLIVPIRAAR